MSSPPLSVASEYEQSAYYYDGDSWVAMTGNVDADKVIMREDITMAGNYTQVGNLTKGQNATGTLASKGKSIAEVLTEILSKRLQPTITAQPSISGFALSGAKAVEAGTKLASVNYTAGTLNPGSYQYGPETGVVASNWVVQRITDKGTVQISGVNAASLSAGSDDNDGDGFTIGDVGGENVFASLKYKAVATHGAGVTAKDNLGDDSNPPVSIAAGEKEKATSAYTPYRNYFSGATTSKPTLDSAYIRGLTKSNKPYAAGTLTINVAAGTQRVCIACLASKTGVTKVINETAMNADVTSTFTQSTVDVEGAEGYTAQSYKVWVFEPAVPYEKRRSAEGHSWLRGGNEVWLSITLRLISLSWSSLWPSPDRTASRWIRPACMALWLRRKPTLRPARLLMWDRCSPLWKTVKRSSTKSRTPLVRWSRSADSATWVLPPILKYKKCCPRFSRMTITLNRRNQNVLQY